MLKYLVDSVILIDHLNGVRSATKWLSRTSHLEIAISVVTRAEILVGVSNNEELELVTALVEAYECLPITSAIADKAAELRRIHKWKLPDAFQAAIALTNNLKLVTRNSKDFPADKLLFVHQPY